MLFQPHSSRSTFLITQLFTNIIGNSIKYKKDNEPCKIEVTFKMADQSTQDDLKFLLTDKYVEIKICENRICFDRGHNEKIFVFFQRLHLKEKYSGTGTTFPSVKKLLQIIQGLFQLTEKKVRALASAFIFLIKIVTFNFVVARYCICNGQ